jgi:hypothetical protein
MDKAYAVSTNIRSLDCLLALAMQGQMQNKAHAVSEDIGSFNCLLLLAMQGEIQ